MFLPVPSTIMNPKEGGRDMFHTVEDVLRLEGFEGVRLVAGRRGLGRTVTSASLMEVPDILPYVEENTLTVNVNRLRRKLEAAGLRNFITTKIGSGYLIE